MSTTNTQGIKNGQVRKSLASQLDRLDGIIDTLAEGLNEAVAMTVQEAVGLAVKEAVQAALTEVLTNRALLEALAPTPTTSSPPAAPVMPSNAPGESWWSRLKGAVGPAWSKACTLAAKACAGAVTLVRALWGLTRPLARAAGQKVAGLVRLTWLWALFLGSLAKQFRKPLLVALGVGTVLGVACFFAGPVVSSLVNAVAGIVGTLVVSSVNALWRAMAPDIAGAT